MIPRYRIRVENSSRYNNSKIENVFRQVEGKIQCSLQVQKS